MSPSYACAVLQYQPVGQRSIPQPHAPQRLNSGWPAHGSHGTPRITTTLPAEALQKPGHTDNTCSEAQNGGRSIKGPTHHQRHTAGRQLDITCIRHTHNWQAVLTPRMTRCRGPQPRANCCHNDKEVGRLAQSGEQVAAWCTCISQACSAVIRFQSKHFLPSRPHHSCWPSGRQLASSSCLTAVQLGSLAAAALCCLPCSNLHRAAASTTPALPACCPALARLCWRPALRC